jgi:type IV secretion system protein VirD4|tara:strand:+ start:442 stop:2604 length:2163 start_codon:yes stop_codon:yes gene_type:complete
MTRLEGRLRQLGGVLLIGFFAFLIGYVLASGLAQYRYDLAELDLFFIATQYGDIQARDPRGYVLINFVVIATTLAGFMLAAKVTTEDLTRFGKTSWQTKRQMKRKRFLTNPAKGFVLGKTGDPGSNQPFIVSAEHPHALIVAPTGRGKGVGFVIPNCLTYAGSSVVLDVKGENFELTSRHRKARGDTVYRFAPTDWESPSHRYNPLKRVGKMKNPAQRMMELQKIAKLFLQAGQGAEEFLPGATDIFVACGMLAYEKTRVTLGEIYRYAVQGGETKTQYAYYARIAEDPATKMMFNKLANITERTLSAYLSVLSSSGLGTWANPRICALTDDSDFEFVTFRKKPQTVYLVVPPDDVAAIAPLIRLFFSDLISSLQGAGEPGQDEPWPVLIMLDEFDKLGKMPIVAESIKTLRSYGGNLAIVTQTVPALDEIYGQNVRLSLQGGAGIKLYLTPSEEKTVSDLSRATGMTTRRVVSKSRTIGQGAFNGVNVSERTEERPLLSEDEARRLPKDDVIIIVDADMPIRAKRIKYFSDAKLKPMFEAQTGPMPMPPHNPAMDKYVFPDIGLMEADAARAAEKARVRLLPPPEKVDAEASPEVVEPVAVGKDASVETAYRTIVQDVEVAAPQIVEQNDPAPDDRPRSSRRLARKAPSADTSVSAVRSNRRPQRKAVATAQLDLALKDVPDTPEARAVVDRTLKKGRSMLDDLRDKFTDMDVISQVEV